MSHGTCRSCGAPIRWVVTVKGHRMPLDPEPHPEGNVIRQPDTGTALPFATDPRALVLPEPPTGQPAWRSHFATCPNASRHRRS